MTEGGSLDVVVTGVERARQVKRDASESVEKEVDDPAQGSSQARGE